MKDKIRTALEGGGGIHILIHMDRSKTVSLCVSEDWARLTSVERAEIPAERLDGAEDPDQVIREEVQRLVDKAHMNYKVREIRIC